MFFQNIDLEQIMFSIGSIDVQLSLIIFVVIGFLAQAIDGALGMAYGVSSNSFLLSFGVPVPVASASTHLAEIATTAVSGLSHIKLGNVDKPLLKKLVIPGVIGSVLGAFLLTFIWQETSGPLKNYIKLAVGVYLLAMGIRILVKAFKRKKDSEQNEMKPGALAILAGVGGLSDAIGGGGWGPIVTSTLVSKGYFPRHTIGSVNTAEFFVTVAQVTVFLAMLKIMNWQVIIGLIIGGCIAAPFAAKLCKVISAKAMMIIVGVIIILLQINTLSGVIPKLFS